ncbi:small acid-soluble spore protein SspI, partial [Bacillus pumilus]|uniref:small acid-soluble spore protein SspI n=1 Tax=Bacillus pumilus TaxID=1408 RepID=UPI0028CB2AB7
MNLSFTHNTPISIKKRLSPIHFNLTPPLIQNITAHNQEHLHHTILHPIQTPHQKIFPPLPLFFQLLSQEPSQNQKNQILQ